VTLNVISAHRMSRWNIFFFPVSFGKMNLGHSRPLLRGLLTFPKIYNNNALAAWRRALLHIWFGCNLLGNLEVQK